MQSNELFGKMDALLHRHRRVDKPNSDNLDDLPVLTEVVDDGLIQPAISLSVVPHGPSGVLVQPAADADAIAERVRQATLERVPSQVEEVLGQRMNAEIGRLIEQIATGMTAELKITVREMVREAVADVVDSELEQWRNSSASRDQSV